MVTSIVIAGKETTNVVGYSASEDSTPIRGGDNSGGVGTISVSIAEEDDAVRILFTDMELADGLNGETAGRINAVGGDELAASLDADSRLIAMVEEVKAAPYIGTLGGAVRYYLSLGGVSAEIFIDPVTDARPVAFIGWDGVLWDKIKDLCSAFQIEVSLVAGAIVLRQVRGRVAENSGDSAIGWNLDSGSMSQNYTMNNYNLTTVTAEMVYPRREELGSASVISLGAGETQVIELQTDVSLLSIEQPQVSQSFDRFYSGPFSLYAILDNDGAQLGAAEWARIGGKLSVEISPDDASVIILTARGGTTQERAPYRIARPDGGEGRSDAFSALCITGTGVGFRKDAVVIPTGVPASMTGNMDGTTVDNIFVKDAGHGFELAMHTAPSYAAPSYSISVSTSHINRRGETGSLSYTSYSEFAALSGAETYLEFEIEWNGKIYTDFLEYYYDLTANTFENQAFGNVGGARVRYRDCWFRIRSATIGPDSISYTAESDTILSDFTALWGDGASYADFEAQWGNELSYMNFGVIPLWRT